MSVGESIRVGEFFLPRRALLSLGFEDADLRDALAAKQIFRVRHGWYSVPSAPEAGVRAVRVGGRLTSDSALEAMGVPVPRQRLLHVAVKPTDSRLRDPEHRRSRLVAGTRSGVRVHWSAEVFAGGTAWQTTAQEAVLAILREAEREPAVAVCSAVLRRLVLSRRQLHEVFAAGPARVAPWQRLVSELDESHGETFFRLRMQARGVRLEQQPMVDGVGRVDFRVGRAVYVEVDGAQHDPRWVGSGGSWESDHDRDAAIAALGGRVLRFTYRQLYTRWPSVLAAVLRCLRDESA